VASQTSVDHWARVRAVFDEAAGRSRGGREAYLAEACSGDPLLLKEVESLLDAHDRAEGFLEMPVFDSAPGLLEGFEAESLEGQTIGPYIIRQEVGRGGMGIVYLADDTRLARRVALKAFAPEMKETGRERLRLEARAAAGLSHPGIATVYTLEEIDGTLYIVSEYVPGPTLRTVVGSGPLPAPQVLDIATQLARALAAAHAQGVIHRDLKPENVIRTAPGVVKILDFGIARTDHLTATTDADAGGTPGTPRYMAPEQIRGEAVDFRADVFAFGLLVFELASGAHAFEGGSSAATVKRMLTEEPAPLAALPDAYEALRGVVDMCLRKEPGRRYESTYRLVADLERIQKEVSSDAGRQVHRQEPEAVPAGPRPRAWWTFHQAMVSAIYAVMLYPAWFVRPWLAPWGNWFLLAILTCATAAATLRLHLLFTGRFHGASELQAEQIRTQAWIRWSDLGIAACLLAGAVGVADANAAVAMLFVTVAIAAALTSFIIEPATTRAAFESRND
jgi:hypothetical protein